MRQKDAHCEDQFLHISELRGPTHTELRGSFGLCLRRAGLLRGLSFFPRRARAAEEIEDDGPGPVIASKKICERWRQDAPAEVSEASSTPEAVSLTNVYTWRSSSSSSSPTPPSCSSSPSPASGINHRRASINPLKYLEALETNSASPPKVSPAYP